MTAIIKFEEQFLGLIVPKVYDLVQYDLGGLNPPSEELFSHAVFPFLTGYFRDENNKIAMLLGAKAILNHAV